MPVHVTAIQQEGDRFYAGCRCGWIDFYPAATLAGAGAEAHLDLTAPARTDS